MTTGRADHPRPRIHPRHPGDPHRPDRRPGHRAEHRPDRRPPAALLGWYAPGRRRSTETLLLLTVLALAAEEGFTQWKSADGPHHVLRTAAATLAALSLLLARRHPTASAVLPVLTAGLLNRAFPGLFSVYHLAATGRFAPAAVGGATIALIGAARADSLPAWVGTTASQLLIQAAAFSLGLWQHGRRVLIETLHTQVDVLRREREFRAEQARSAERARIAREMHDVLAHRLSLLVLHAGVLRDQARAGTVAEDPDRLAHRLELLRTAAARSLDDLRDVVGALRAEPRPPDEPDLPEPSGTPAHPPGTEGASARHPPPAGPLTGGPCSPRSSAMPTPMPPTPPIPAPVPAPVPAPALRDLTELVGEATAAGQTVELALDGDPETVPTTHRLAVHRLVQEALTNARKHAYTAPVTVRVRYGAPATTVEVRNAAGEPAPSGAGTGGGYGLVGLAERVGALGGHLDAGADGHGGYRLAARLPSPERPATLVPRPTASPQPSPPPPREGS
ncbi:sensor histidine kinase [Kitasatospora sp. NPDC091207]|uniref:sensor histidine kinase n=1 Tax=Kitasatospora sp. NPDC091207 TaxID=3364083 RepID=UPI0037FC1947